MIFKKIDKIYKNDDSILKYRASYLLIILIVIFVFCLTLTVVTALQKNILDYIGYILGTVFSPLFIFLILKGRYTFTSYISSILFTLTITIGLSTGELREYEITFLTLIIIYVLFFTSKKAAYLVTAYCLAFFTIIYIIKQDTQVFSQTFYMVSLSTMILLFVLSRVHLSIMEEYISTISAQKNSLEEEVIERTVELKNSKEHAESLFINSPYAIYSVNEDCLIVDFNNKAEEITGYSREDVLGQEFDLFFESINAGTSHIKNEFTIRTKNNEEIVITRSSSALYNDKGKIYRHIESFIDITEKKELEKFKTDIEKVIRHDLKTPLNSIIGFPKMMLTDEDLSEEYRKYLMIILSSGQSMLNLINASLDLYKIEDGSYKVHKEETDLLLILEQISNELRELSLQKKSSINILFNDTEVDPSTIILLTTERSLLYMILTNLIKNALEASPKGEKVTVLINDGKTLQLSIHNAGVIPEEIRDRFFEKNVTSGKSHGNGLGTYSAKIMAEAIDADIYFETGENKGTTIFLTI